MTTAIRFNILRAIAILIFIASASILANPALAQDATSSTSRREKIQDRIETMKQKLASREAALKAKLSVFKDKRKAQAAERINTNLNKINENQTSQMQKHLDKMSEILAKLETRVNSSSSDIKDPMAAKTAIASARASIATASAAVSEQSQKDYTITVTSETKVREDAQKVKDQLKTDIAGVRALVIEAKQSVSEAIRIAKSQTKETTPSGQ